MKMLQIKKLSGIVKGICYNEFSMGFLNKYMENIGNSFKEAMMNKSTCIFPHIVGDYRKLSGSEVIAGHYKC